MGIGRAWNRTRRLGFCLFLVGTACILYSWARLDAKPSESLVGGLGAVLTTLGCVMAVRNPPGGS